MELKLLKGMRKNRFIKIIFLTLIVFNFNVNAQNFNVFANNGSPEAKSTLNSGNGNSVDMYNGKLNTTINLHQFKGREFDLPMSITYSASGIKVDQVATSVGLGWNLNVGGRVDRVTRLAPDDIQSLNSNVCQSPEASYYVDDKMDYYNVNAPGINDIAGYVSDNPNSANSTWNYMKSRLTPSKTYVTNGLNEWIMTDENGNKYYFGFNDKIEKITTFSNSSPTCQDNISTNSLLLTKIVSRNNLDIYDFTYQNFIWSSRISNNGEGEIYGNWNFINNSNYKLNQQMVSEIKHNGEKIIGFVYAPRTDLEFVGGNTVGNRLIEILFFNFKSQNSVYKKINFVQSYFGNTNTGTVFYQKRLKLDEIIFSGVYNSIYDVNDKYSFEYQSPELIPSLQSYARDYNGLYNGKYENTSLIPSTQINSFNDLNIDSVDNNRCFNLEKSKIGTLTKIIYPNKSFSTFEYEQHALNGGYGTTVIPATYKYDKIIECELTPASCNGNSNYHQINIAMQNKVFTNAYNNYNITSNNLPKTCYTVKTTLLRINQSKNYKFEAFGEGIYLIQKINNCNTANDVNICNFEILNNCLTSCGSLFYNGNINPLPENFYFGGYTNEISDKYFDSGNYQVTIWSYSQNYNVSLQILTQTTLNPVILTPEILVNKDVSTNFIQGFRLKSISNFESENIKISKKSFKYTYGFKTNHVNNFGFSKF